MSFFRFFNQQRLIAFSSSTNIRRRNTLEDEIGDDDFREVSGDKSMIKRTFETYIRGIPVGNILDSYMPRGAMARTRKFSWW